MLAALTRTARERMTLRHLLGYLAAIALVYGFTRDLSMILGIGTAFAISEAMALVRETPGIDGRWAGVGTGLFVTGLSLVWFAYEYAVPAADGPLWFPLLTAGAGVWFLLDARRDFVEGRRRDGTQPADEMTSSEA